MPVIIIAAVLSGVGMYLLGLNLLRIPTKKSRRAFDATVERQSTKPKRIDRWMDSLRQWIAGHLKINPYRRMELEEDLFAAEMNMTPEQYISDFTVSFIQEETLQLQVTYTIHFPIEMAGQVYTTANIPQRLSSCYHLKLE